MSRDKPPERALLLGSYEKRGAGRAQALASQDMAELGSLAHSAGAVVVDTWLKPHDGGGPLGRGTLDAVRDRVAADGLDLVIWADELTPRWAREWETQFACRVIDRTELILDIFSRRANSREGRLQVEMAQLTYRLPRLAVRQQGLSRTGGGIGTRGPGETRLEVDRRRVRERLAALAGELERVGAERRVRRERRAAGLVPTVALVGYTNVGKSSLFRMLSGRGALVADQLFATLDPGVRRVHVAGFGPVLLVDTVGFVRRLPHALVAAFTSTLDEVRDADLLLVVVDASRDGARQEAVVDEVLAEVGAAEIPRILVENQWDRVPASQRPHGVPVSAATGWNQAELVGHLAAELRRARPPVEIAIPWAAGEALGWIRAEGEILDQRLTATGVSVRFSAPPAVVNRVARRVGGGGAVLDAGGTARGTLEGDRNTTTAAGPVARIGKGEG